MSERYVHHLRAIASDVVNSIWTTCNRSAGKQTMSHGDVKAHCLSRQSTTDSTFCVGTEDIGTWQTPPAPRESTPNYTRKNACVSGFRQLVSSSAHVLSPQENVRLLSALEKAPDLWSASQIGTLYRPGEIMVAQRNYGIGDIVAVASDGIRDIFHRSTNRLVAITLLASRFRAATRSEMWDSISDSVLRSACYARSCCVPDLIVWGLWPMLTCVCEGDFPNVGILVNDVTVLLISLKPLIRGEILIRRSSGDSETW
eukprot:Gregarina_sp_Poly_1__11498@NODE_992_length_5447_cov_380_777509_g696_i0_p2_GENE_NODE_992_length_5447_cov_380_777509_g696_i0NODE_992_length_5447_cov_380_777509_g696_i0_p2_ORF_typecomplete_len257_score26_89_NODE_992_length_5447_cov_380_777509_g696_i028273597